MRLRDFFKREQKADYFWCFDDVRDLLVKNGMMPSLAAIEPTPRHRVTFLSSDLTEAELDLEIELHTEPSRCSPVFPTSKEREWVSAGRESLFPRAE